MESPWTAFIVMTVFAILTAVVAFVGGALKKAED
jgi:hypothetical protein